MFAAVQECLLQYKKKTKETDIALTKVQNYQHYFRPLQLLYEVGLYTHHSNNVPVFIVLNTDVYYYL